MSNKSMDSFISNVVEKPQVFFGANAKIVGTALEMAKHFYDSVKKVEQTQFSPFPELFTEGFDNDQIWEEITLQNEPFLEYAQETLKSFEESDQSSDQQDIEMEEAESAEEEVSAGEEESAEEMALESDKEDENAEEEQESELEQEEESEKEQEDEIPRKTSEVDDDFFNLDEFNKWTEEQEELDMMSDREDQDDGIDYDKDLDEEDDSEEDEDEDAMNDAADMTYEDFFGSKERVKPKKPYIPKKSVTFKEEDDNDDEEEEEEEEGPARDLFAEDDEDEEMNEEKSAFEKQQERIQKQIEEFEEENIQGRHWTLQGEAGAKARPVNSLLEEDLEFEHANKPVPVITQEITNTLEEMIKKRILDNMFDDVERKVDPTLKPFVPSKRVELSDEKNKKSLADLYEDDFVRQKNGEEHKDARDEALEKDHQEITDLFKTLCYKLDALSNFHYTPKAVKPEMTIISNSAAISMEEVTPVNVSEATLLAPEEVYDKKRADVKAVEEMDQAERKRLRAQKKKLKRKENEMKEKQLKIMQKYNPQVGVKQAKKKAVKELLRQKNVTVIGK